MLAGHLAIAANDRLDSVRRELRRHLVPVDAHIGARQLSAAELGTDVRDLKEWSRP